MNKLFNKYGKQSKSFRKSASSNRWAKSWRESFIGTYETIDDTNFFALLKESHEVNSMQRSIKLLDNNDCDSTEWCSICGSTNHDMLECYMFNEMIGFK